MIALTVLITLMIAYSRANNDMITSYVSSTYDWDSRSSSVSATCVTIPKNLSLCSNIGYDKMRLPNLLEHDTLSEVSQQASSWVPLLNVRCHPDTQRFLCSLFSPVCLDHPIYPCRSLCEKVKAGCEIRMKMYGFPWPEMFACTLFPQDNDMCIQSESATNSSSEEKCKICEQINTKENVLDYYCQSDFAVRGKLHEFQQNLFILKKIKLFKAKDQSQKEFNGELFQFNLTEECCREKLKVDRANHFIMGNYRDKRLVPTFIMPWVSKRSKSFKKTIKMLKTINCTNPDAIRHTMIQPTSVPVIPSTAAVRMNSKLRHANKTQSTAPKARKKSRNQS